MTRFMKPGTPEWNRAWREIAHLPVNRGLANPSAARDPLTGETWQYMGTTDGWHEFRHRRHPNTGTRLVAQVQVAWGV